MLKKYMYKTKAVVLAEDTCNSLGVVRGLAQRGIPVFKLGSGNGELLFLSRYGEKVIAPSLESSEDKFIQFLIDFGKKQVSKPVLFITNDIALSKILRHEKSLRSFYYIPSASLEIINKFIDKKKFYKMLEEMDVSHPKTFFPQSVDEIEAIRHKLLYPCIIKPADSYTFQKQFGVKCIKIENFSMLKTRFKEVSRQNVDVMIQEIIPGNEIYMFYVYFNQNSEPLATCGYNKVRQYPYDFGTGCFCESFWKGEPIQIGIDVLKKTKFYGIAEPEFKKDPRDNKFKLLEINVRTSTQNRLPAECGTDMEYLAYLDAIGEPLPLLNKPRDNIKWINLKKDICSYFFNGNGEDAEKIRLFSWFNFLKGKTVYAIFSWRDPVPFMKSCFLFFALFFKKIARFRNG